MVLEPSHKIGSHFLTNLIVPAKPRIERQINLVSLGLKQGPKTAEEIEW